MGRSKPGSLADVARRWDRSPIPTGPSIGNEDPGQRPSGILAAGIIVALMVMLGGIVWVWQSNPPSPAAANTAPSSAAIGEALNSAKAHMQQGKWLKADEVLIPATAKFPDDQSLRIARAECLVALKRFPEAYSQYEKALAIGPREAPLEFAAGVTAGKANLTDRAFEHLSMAQTADPQNAGYAIALAHVHRKQGNLEAAKASLLRAANLDADNAFVWGTLADISLGENNVNIALQHIAKARTIQPDSTEWRVLEARAHKRKGEPERALHTLNAIESRQRKDPAVARLISECYGMLGRPVDAAALMGDASLASPTDPALAYDAAVAFERAGNKAKAIEFARYAKALGSEAAAKLLAKLAQ